MLRHFISVIAIAGMLWAPTAQAREFHTHRLAHDGFELKAHAAIGHATYGLVGDAGSFYLTDNVYLGGAGYGGGSFSTGASSTDYLAYGGLVVGMEDNVLGPFGYDAHLLVGGGIGSYQSAPQRSYVGAGVVVEPSMGVMIKVPSFFKLTLGASFLFFPGALGLSGPALSLSFH